jgi:hypothetical protein
MSMSEIAIYQQLTISRPESSQVQGFPMLLATANREHIPRCAERRTELQCQPPSRHIGTKADTQRFGDTGFCNRF